MNALRPTDSKMLTHLTYMAQRLVVLRTLLQPTGSIDFHCDPTASSYIKMMMDDIFGHQNFPSEIVRLDPNRQPAKVNTSQGIHNVLWLGIDIACHAIRWVGAIRLGERCMLSEGKHLTISHVPGRREGAQDLWQRDSCHFQMWIVEEMDIFVTAKRTADGGTDGHLYVDCPGKPDLQSMVISKWRAAQTSPLPI